METMQTENWILKVKFELDMMVHCYNPNIWAAKQEDHKFKKMNK
jgi:hypothetical protein